MYRNKLIRKLLLIVLFSIINGPANTQSNVPVYSYTILKEYPHNKNSFTQGLFYENGTIYESTGQKGYSRVYKYALNGKRTPQIHKLDSKYFGEGLTVLDGKIFQITWLSSTGFIYDKYSLRPIKTFHYTTEGWGLTHNSKELIMSDGTSTLYFLEPATLRVVHTISVTADNIPVKDINELEYINGMIYANIWKTQKIAIIDPQTGNIIQWLDLTGLLDYTPHKKTPGVLNGIAYNPENDSLIVTGKYWPKMFEIKIVKGH
ncbi:MAG: glutaminyl-peptide cyclotransferase [Candidatus Omnitrophica bacterium]|nr:glutaminyl-peptide cyclotransferase [Candidatus Omnitrophota bacterium]MDD5080646.1 glutaminyl-peptide cyclotransferase [Candidatus Omnitrophota bacterium]